MAADGVLQHTGLCGVNCPHLGDWGGVMACAHLDTCVPFSSVPGCSSTYAPTLSHAAVWVSLAAHAAVALSS